MHSAWGQYRGSQIGGEIRNDPAVDSLEWNVATASAGLTVFTRGR